MQFSVEFRLAIARRTISRDMSSKTCYDQQTQGGAGCPERR